MLQPRRELSGAASIWAILTVCFESHIREAWRKGMPGAFVQGRIEWAAVKTDSG